MTTQTIELDCAPGDPRPGDLLATVLKDTGLEPREPVSKFFGNWRWDYSDVPPDRWSALQPTFRDRIRNLYDAGLIRYGSW